MGNVKNDEEFFKHFGFLVSELYRVMAPGRIMAVHCMNLPASKSRDGFIGIKDFRGDLIKQFQQSGFIYHSEVCIWKDPVVAMQRTKALGLLHKTIKKDSSMSRQGIPDYLIAMRKPGINEKPIAGEFKYYVGDNPPSGFVGFQRDDGRFYYQPGQQNTSIDVWQNYASPVWDDIRQTNTLQYQTARDHDDERHICPLQLDVIERAMQLWSMPGDVVLSPFMGIGSETYMAVKMGRKAIGAELKQSYFALAASNMRRSEESQYEMAI
jgi:DNA modification methylase